MARGYYYEKVKVTAAAVKFTDTERRMVLDGTPVARIAESRGVSRQRVHQMIDAEGLGPGRAAAKQQRSQRVASERDAARRANAIRPSHKFGSGDAVPEADVIAELQRVWKIAGDGGATSLSLSTFDRLSQRAVTSGKNIIKVFGSWSAACAAAGVPTRDVSARRYDRRWSDEDIEKMVRDFSAESYDRGEQPTVRRMTAWLRAEPERTMSDGSRRKPPSGAAVRLYLGPRVGEIMTEVADAKLAS